MEYIRKQDSLNSKYSKKFQDILGYEFNERWDNEDKINLV